MHILKFFAFALSVPPSCKQQRLWQVERTLGAVLKEGQSGWYHQALRRSECYERCLQAGMQSNGSRRVLATK